MYQLRKSGLPHAFYFFVETVSIKCEVFGTHMHMSYIGS